uniref:Uncharacterized protein n=1 Tax=Lactuca sativa TaxID=4236 RepID=A0A9R1XXG5_LACSA|nr:hypothetical protein LSAT_V11C100033010 [Lactuca sativa]
MSGEGVFAHHQAQVPKGCLVVKVGEAGGEQQRSVVPIIRFNHPLFMQLLREAKEEYGFKQKGTITIPCNIHHFLLSSVASSTTITNNLGALGVSYFKIKSLTSSSSYGMCFCATCRNSPNNGYVGGGGVCGVIMRLRHHQAQVPKGCLVVKVGEAGGEQQRSVVPIIRFNHPLFMQLLREAKEEYGFKQKGTITIPCNIHHFLLSSVASSTTITNNLGALGVSYFKV